MSAAGGGVAQPPDAATVTRSTINMTVMRSIDIAAFRGQDDARSYALGGLQQATARSQKLNYSVESDFTAPGGIAYD